MRLDSSSSRRSSNGGLSEAARSLLILLATTPIRSRTCCDPMDGSHVAATTARTAASATFGDQKWSPTRVGALDRRAQGNPRPSIARRVSPTGCVTRISRAAIARIVCRPVYARQASASPMAAVESKTPVPAPSVMARHYAARRVARTTMSAIPISRAAFAPTAPTFLIARTTCRRAQAVRRTACAWVRAGSNVPV